MDIDVLIIGGGASGVAAGLQAARLGVSTLIIEETEWLGGMITSAGVSAFDGNKYALGGGIFGELRQRLEDYYGGPRNTFTGWISLTCFEPKIGMQFLSEMANVELKLSVFYQTKLVEILKEGNRLTGAVVERNDGERVKISAKVIIEATEWGDVLKLADVPYRLGRDAKSDTGEPDALDVPDDELQDMTFCAILKKYDGNASKVEPSKNYNPDLFTNSTSIICSTLDEKVIKHKLHTWNSFITYATLPNEKYLLNWPLSGNDYYPTPIEIYENPSTREHHFQKAKEYTLDYIHYMQTALGHPEWGIAEDEFPTEDHLPFIPYVRESRRIKGRKLMVESDVIPVEGSFRPPLQKSGIAVGDYFLDHHHASFFNEKQLVENLPDNAPFQVPFECLLPNETKGLIIAEKSISVTHIVNGCTRLQPVVMLIGQAAGAAAALAVKNNIDVEDVNVTGLQDVLLEAGAQIFPYKDLYPTDRAFIAAQKLALAGLIMDNSDFLFIPEKIVTIEEDIEWKAKLGITEDIDLIGMARADAFILLSSRVAVD